MRKVLGLTLLLLGAALMFRGSMPAGVRKGFDGALGVKPSEADAKYAELAGETTAT